MDQIFIYLFKMTVRFEFTVGATILVVRSPILAIRWSKTLIRRRSSEPLLQQSVHRWWQYDGWRHQFAGSYQSHYFGSLGTGGVHQSHYLTIHPPMVTIRQRSSKPLFRRFGHRTSTTSGSIGWATGVGSLLKIN